MSNGIWIAASGARAQMTAMDVTANNVANATSTAFRAEQTLFQEHLIDAGRAGAARDVMRYNGVAEVATDITAGPIRVTNRKLDFAVRGDSFFSVMTPQGERFTRAGSLRVDPNGALTLQDGTPVLNTARRPITVPNAGHGAAINAEGGIEVNGEPVGQLRFVRFNDTRALEREGHTLFRATPGSGAPLPVVVQLETEALEMSNVSVVKGMTDMVSTTRSFDALEQVIDVFRQADKRAANDLMRKR